MTESVLTTEQQLASIWALGGLTWKQLARNVWKEMNDDNVFGRASELAYNFLLSIFPLFLFLLALFGIFASHGTQLRANLFFYLSQALPPAAFQIISQTIEEVTKNTGGGKLTFGLALALWSASGGMTTMISVLNEAYGVRESRSWLRVHLVAVGLTAAISVLVVSALLLILLGGWLAPLIGAKLGMGALFVVGWKIVQYLSALAFILVSFAVIYYFAPDLREQHWYWITPGSLVGVALWITASFGFRLYLHFFNTYSKTYGSIGAVIILLLWFYITGLAFLIGGEANSEIEHAAAERGHPEAKLEGRKAA